MAASAGDLLTATCRGSLTSLAYSENGPLTALGEAEEAEGSRPSGCVAASTGDLLTAMCRGSLTSLAYSENGPLTVMGGAEEAKESRLSGSVAASAGDSLTTMCRDSPASPAESENGPLTSWVTQRGQLVILDSAVHSSARSNLLTRLTRCVPVLVGGTTEGDYPLAPPIMDPSPTVSREWASGPLRS